MKPRYGYCSITGDFLHIGHIEFLKACKELCDVLIVGVTSDDYVMEHKKRKPFMTQDERAELAKAIRYVDRVVIQESLEFPHSIIRMRNFHEGNFVIIDSDENMRRRGGADIIVEGGINRKYGIRSTQKVKDTDTGKFSL